MGSMTEGDGILPFRILESSSDEWSPSDAVIFFGLSLVLGIACRHVLRGTRVPYTVALLVIGIGLGSLGIGIAFGIASVLWLGFIFNDTVIEIALTLAVSYIAFFTQLGEMVSLDVTLDRFYAAVARTAFKGDGQQSLHHFWYA
ncbi:unnamed protein product [Dovyalis caffra]|uniref:Sodium/hydrogen exchanger n=1 Tax=Dovyalis caffra TaxID=77055 RepID=A0AAV1R2Z2_9ROSI|nr:unnamed protein product [Dovyalis caffra]